ncbi:PD-(D/E)XK nuclease family protein [Salinispora vitiensis]|uniref:PD-(D/E)XK nuclease family protein n=1 Tax=Salinispora vitiensis TaxID=999544 RepID=UPI000364D9B1|nr:PD-(D/E)XK nuclease family protein [Salinispora vitiensis]
MIDLLTADADQVRALVAKGVSQAFIAETTQRARDPHHLGLSSIGGCTRAAAYALARVDPSDTPPVEEGRQANLGVWYHEGLLPRLSEQMGGEVELPVVLHAAGVAITGTADLVPPGAVVDLKTVGAHKLQTIRYHVSPYRRHRLQVLGYVLAVQQGGRPTRWAIWIYMDRSTGEVEVIVEEFTARAALEVIDRIAEIRRYAEHDPDLAPAEDRGPGLSFTCDACPWLRRCWGPDAVPGQIGAQTSLVAGAIPQVHPPDPRAVQALSSYKDASVRKGEAERDQKFWGSVIAGLDYGVYGAWKLTRDRDADTMDQERVRREYDARRHSCEPPTRRKRGALRVTLIEANGAKTTREVGP